MREAVIAGYLRTAQSRSRPNDPERDWFHQLRADDLLSMLLPELLEIFDLNKGDGFGRCDPGDVGHLPRPEITRCTQNDNGDSDLNFVSFHFRFFFPFFFGLASGGLFLFRLLSG